MGTTCQPIFSCCSISTLIPTMYVLLGAAEYCVSTGSIMTAAAAVLSGCLYRIPRTELIILYVTALAAQRAQHMVMVIKEIDWRDFSYWYMTRNAEVPLWTSLPEHWGYFLDCPGSVSWWLATGPRGSKGPVEGVDDVKAHSNPVFLHGPLLTSMYVL